MKTFSRRARKAQGLFEPESDQANSAQANAAFDDLLHSQNQHAQDPYWPPDSLPAVVPTLKQASPKPKAPSQSAAGTSAVISKPRAADHHTKQAPGTSLLITDQHPNKPSRSSKGSGRSIGSNVGTSVPKPASQDTVAVSKPVSKSGRLLGAYKGKGSGTAASPAVKRKGSNPAEQGEVPSKKPRVTAAAKLAAPEPAVALAATLLGEIPATSSLTSALPVAMARLLNPAALRDSAPAQTVMEAQELGEQARHRDDAMWALDGLCMSNSPNTLRESVVALLDICASRRGRLALRSGGVAEEVVATLGKLKLQEDAVLALGAAAIVACFCHADADPALLANEETAHLIAALLKVEESVPENSAPASFAGRILKVLQEGAFLRLLPQEEATNPVSVVLAAVAGLLDPNRCANMDPCKHALRQAGALQRVAQLAASHGYAISDAAPTMQTVRALWKLNKSLLVLENACFACPDNEAHLAAVTVSTVGAAPQGSRVELGLAEWVVRQVEVLGQQGLSGGFKKDCLRALLAVLMNMTQNNPAGCEGVVADGVLEAVAPVLAQIALGGPRTKGCIHDLTELDSWVDELSCCLGLLINLMEHKAAWRQRLRQLDVATPRRAGASSNGSGAQQNLVSLLCAMITSVIPPSRYTNSPITRRLSTLSAGRETLNPALHTSDDEITVENLEAGADAGAASIVEVYAAILLGFLVEGCGEARTAAAALLPTQSLELVVAAVRRCLHFYVSAGAMTKGNEESLRQLLASLEEQQQEEKGD